MNPGPVMTIYHVFSVMLFTKYIITQGYQFRGAQSDFQFSVGGNISKLPIEWQKITKGTM